MSRPVGCREAVARLWRYLDDELDDVDRQAVDLHLAWCLRCCGELDFAREVRATLDRASTVSLPEDVQQRLELFIDRLDEPAGGGQADWPGPGDPATGGSTSREVVTPGHEGAAHD